MKQLLSSVSTAWESPLWFQTSSSGAADFINPGHSPTSVRHEVLREGESVMLILTSNSEDVWMCKLLIFLFPECCEGFIHWGRGRCGQVCVCKPWKTCERRRCRYFCWAYLQGRSRIDACFRHLYLKRKLLYV